jgi:hypothetical protein
MSILGQYNIFGFYSSISARTWNRQIALDVEEEPFRIFLETNHIPAVELLVSSATSATLTLLDSNDVAVGSPLSMTVESFTGGKRLIYLGTTLSSNDDGDYSLKITIDGSTNYYSDVFGWTSNSDYLAELTKISAVSSNIRLGKSYFMNLTGFTFECYINAEYLGLTPDIQEDISERFGSTNILYGSFASRHEFNVWGNEYMQRFLTGLRILESNGTVTITHGGISFTANDIAVEKTEDVLTDVAFMMKLTFVDHSELISVYNETN